MTILEMPQPTISRHLAYLRRSPLVGTRRGGLWTYYSLADAKLSASLQHVFALRHSVNYGFVAKTRCASQPNDALPSHHAIGLRNAG